MKKILIGLFTAFSLFASLGASAADHKPQITFDQLENMFAKMRAGLGDKVDGELLWGYFFTDTDASKLQPVADFLSQEGYRVVSIYQSQNKDEYFLHVEKVEHHTAESLNQRNTEFYKLADKYNLNSYDGMDVGPVGK